MLGVAVRQRRAAPIGERGHADLVEQRVGLVDVEIGRARGDVTLASRMRNQRHLHVLTHGHRRERRGDLEGSADAGTGDRAGRQAVDAPPEQRYAARVRRELAIDEIEAGRLAGAIGPDHRDDLTRSDGEGDIA